MAHGSHLGGSTGIPPDLLQQIIDAGLSDDRMGMAGQKARTGAALFGTPGAQGMNVGGTYKAASPLEHLSTAMSRILGGKMQRDAHGEMEGLLGQKAAGRRAMGQAQAGLFAPPTAGALNAPEPPAFSPPDFAAPGLGFGVDSINETPARALARAMDERSRLGGIAALSGDPAIAASGQGLLADARTLGAQQFEGQQNKLKLLESRQVRDAEAAFKDRQQTEDERHNRAAEARPPSYPVILGGEGQQFRIDPRNPNAPAIPVVDASGNPVLKPQGGAHGAGMADVVERKRVMLSDGQLKTVAEYDRFRDALRDIAARKAQIDTGPVASRRNAAAAKVGADDPAVSAFRASVGDSLSAYIKGLSGAAVSDRERAFLIQNVPKMEDNDAVFSAKLQTVLDRLDRLRAIEIDLFGKQGKDVSRFTGEAPDLVREAAALEGHGAGSASAPEQPRRRRYNPQTGALE
jgi:hypothetical protein